MRINTLRLIAYGRFTDTILDFSDHQAGLHIVYGPNEAGKSTALRALRSLLFGIPVRTPDSFLHPHPKLRIGADLVGSDGKIMTFVRRKGQQKTLRGADDQSLLDENTLSSYLGGVDRDLFAQMFAIGHQDLIQGGEEIISGGGSVGQALFAAGAGLISLQHYQQHLQQAMETIFKPGGSKPRINQTVSALKRTRKNQKEALLLATTWKAHHGNLENAQTRLETNRRQLAECKRRHVKLARIREALPLIARRKEISKALADFEGVPALPEDFGDQRRQAENALTIAGNDLRRIKEDIAALHDEMHTLAVPENLLRHAAMIEALQHDLGSFKKAQQDRPILEARMRALSRQAADKLSQAGITAEADNGDPLCLTATTIGEIQEMGKSHERLATRLDTIRERRRQLETELTMVENQHKALPSPHDIRGIRAILQSAQDEGPLERQLAEARHTLDHREATLRRQLHRQTLWAGTLERLDAVPIPSRESIDRFEERFNRSSHQLERLRADHLLATEEQTKIDMELHTLTTVHDVPSEENLRVARSQRDTGWQLVRRRLEGHDPEEEEIRAFRQRFSPDGALPDAFEASIEAADHIADRLRREAGQVNRKSMLEARQRQSASERRKITAALEKARADHANLKNQWASIWAPAGIQPLSPAEMRAWSADMDSLREKATDLHQQKSKTAALASQIDMQKIRLTDALAGCGMEIKQQDALAELIGIARRYLESQETLRAQVEGLDKTLRQLRRDLQKVNREHEDIQKDLDRWKVLWRHHVTKLGVAPDTGPSAALAVIENIREARAQKSEADVLQKRIRGIDRDAAAFRDRVAQLVDVLADALHGTAPEEASLRLSSELTQARALQARQKDLQRRLDAAQKELGGAQKQFDDTTAAVEALVREARCADLAMLPEIEKRARRRQELQDENKALEDRLRRLGAGATVEIFIAEADAVAADTLEPEMERLAEEIAVLEKDRSALDQTIGTEKAELKRMDGRARAAAYAEDAERLLASLESDVAQYARVKIAQVLLSRTIERYREKHQGPLIRRASALFAQMTGKAFRSVRAEYDPKGRPVLVGMRASDDEAITVAGMSDGTADQLYLALRLASLEHYLDSNEALPFVVDDILLRFDDDRALATLKILSALTQKTQVIFFTHHHRLVELAQTVDGGKPIQVHRLDDAPLGARN
ncbi:MAG: AAA family ATPase [Desulfobacterales bacterium]|jgi:uncharacterized protein YhaN